MDAIKVVALQMVWVTVISVIVVIVLLLLTAASPASARQDRVARTSPVPMRAYSRDTTRLPVRLQLVLRKAAAQCGITIDNTWRKNARKPNGRPSLHASWRAADITSKDYPCVMRVLTDWPGCLSTDWRRMKHIHIDDSHYGAKPRCRFTHVAEGKRHGHFRSSFARTNEAAHAPHRTR
jgi:hypothetical protein